MPEMLALRETDPHQVGSYRLLGRLGEGGQGVVYLAEGPTGGPAAVKLLPPTTDPQVRSRFLKEVGRGPAGRPVLHRASTGRGDFRTAAVHRQ